MTAVIDFQNGTFVKLGPVDPQLLAGELELLLVDGEKVQLAFKGMRDSVVFSDRRIISVNVQGITGKKRDYSSLPLARIQAWSVETAGTFDLDSELELWFSGLGKVRLEFKGSVNIRHISQLIGHHVLWSTPTVQGPLPRDLSAHRGGMQRLSHVGIRRDVES